MTDREKVIKGLEELRDHLFHEYNVCYHGDEEDVYRRFLVVDDALALLKEQEPIPVKRIDGKHNHFIKCGNCNTDLMSGMKYCPQCGKAVKLDD